MSTGKYSIKNPLYIHSKFYLALSNKSNSEDYQRKIEVMCRFTRNSVNHSFTVGNPPAIASTFEWLLTDVLEDAILPAMVQVSDIQLSKISVQFKYEETK